MVDILSETMSLDVLFEEAYSRCESLDSYKKETLTDYLGYLMDLRLACEAGGNDYCGQQPEKALSAIRETVLSVHKTITNYIAADMSLGMHTPKPDLSYLERVSSDDYCAEVYMGHECVSEYAKVKEYSLNKGLHLYDELEAAIEYVDSIYDEDPVVMARMLKHLQVLYIKEGKRLDGSEQNHYSLQDRAGYNYIALQLDAVLAATKSLNGLGK